MVRKVCFAGHMQAGQVGHEVVVHPEAAHGVVYCWENLHRCRVGVLSLDLLVHLEEIPIPGRNSVASVIPDGITEIQKDPQPGGSNSPAFVADLLGGAGGDIPG